MRRSILVITTALAGLGLGCGSSSSSSAPSTGGPTVHLSGIQFSPSTLTVKVGDTVTWVWDNGRHNVVSGTSCTPDGKFSSGDAKTDATFTFTFKAAGEYPYYCTPHCGQGMVAKIVVQ